MSTKEYIIGNQPDPNYWERTMNNLPAPRLWLGFLILGVLLAGCEGNRYAEIIPVEPVVDFALVGASGHPDYEAILASYRPVQDLHVMTFYGDFDELIEGQHRQIMILLEAYPEGMPHKRGCSMFQYGAGSSGLVGRNFDNRFSQLLAGFYYPTDGYASLSFVALMELGFTGGRPFDAQDDSHRRALLSGPAYTIEGMNEKGLTVTLASLGRQEVFPDPDRQPRFLIHLVREILDHAADLEEAVAIASRYNVFDNGRNIISHHIFLADPTGSAVLEWHEGEMKVVRDEGDWQAVTNSTMYEVPENRRRGSCPRYRSLAGVLEKQVGPLDWRAGMDALARTAQYNNHVFLDGENLKISTQWSTVFDPDRLTAYVCLNRDYGRVYQMELPVPP